MSSHSHKTSNTTSPRSPTIGDLEIKLNVAQREKPVDHPEIIFYRKVLEKMKTKHVNAAHKSDINSKKIYRNYLKLNKLKGIFSDISPGLDKATIKVGEAVDTDPFLKEQVQERKIYNDYCLAVIDARIAGEELSAEWKQCSPINRMKSKLNLK